MVNKKISKFVRFFMPHKQLFNIVLRKEILQSYLLAKFYVTSFKNNNKKVKPYKNLKLNLFKKIN